MTQVLRAWYLAALRASARMSWAGMNSVAWRSVSRVKLYGLSAPVACAVHGGSWPARIAALSAYLLAASLRRFALVASSSRSVASESSSASAFCLSARLSLSSEDPDLRAALVFFVFLPSLSSFFLSLSTRLEPPLADLAWTVRPFLTPLRVACAGFSCRESRNARSRTSDAACGSATSSAKIREARGYVASSSTDRVLRTWLLNTILHRPTLCRPVAVLVRGWRAADKWLPAESSDMRDPAVAAGSCVVDLEDAQEEEEEAEDDEDEEAADMLHRQLCSGVS